MACPHNVLPPNMPPLSTHSHITYEDGPRLCSPQASFTLKGEVREEEKEEKRKEGRAEPKARGERERRERERNHRFVKC